MLHHILHHIWKFNASSATAASAVAAMRPLATSTAASFYPVHHQAIMTETCRKCDLAKTTMSTTKRLKTTKKQIEATIQSRSTAGRSCSIPASAITAGSVVIATENSEDVYSCTTCINGATENARPENAGLENNGQLPKEPQGLENAGLENDGQNFSQLWAKLWGLEDAGLENDGPR